MSDDQLFREDGGGGVEQKDKLGLNVSKPGICRKCGYRIRDGAVIHDRCREDDSQNEEIAEEPKQDWPECDRHGKFHPGEKMCPDCFENARMMGGNPLGGAR